jgi:GNAT superfamily N-acetyltransferase
MRISSVVPGDDPATSQAGVLFDEYRVHYGHPSSIEASTRWLADRLRDGKLLAYLAFWDGRPVGLAVVSEVPASLRLAVAWQLRDLYVDPGWRRRGVASRLIDHVLEEAKKSGAIRVSLQTERANHSALRLYRAHGFEPVKELCLLYKPLIVGPG